MTQQQYMTPQEYIEAAEKLGMTPYELGRLIGYSRRMTGYHKTTRGLSEQPAIIVRLLLDGTVTPKQVEAARKRNSVVECANKDLM